MFDVVLIVAVCAAACAACCGYVLVLAFGMPTLPAIILTALLAVGMFMALAATEEDNE